MESRAGNDTPRSRAEEWMAVGLCVAALAAGAVGQLARQRPLDATTWVPLIAAVLAAAAAGRVEGRPASRRLRPALLWSACGLVVWAANGLPLDLIRLVPGLMPPGVDWPRLLTKTLALAAAVVLARLALARPDASAPTRAGKWFGYAAFVLALPYPVLRTSWALGGTLGLGWPGAAGRGWIPWLACMPWLMAAVLSLLLVTTWRWMPRRLMLAAGCFATAAVGLVGPAACWVFVTKLAAGDPGIPGIAMWVPGLFYGSWLLWAFAAGAATRSYQLRTAAIARP